MSNNGSTQVPPNSTGNLIDCSSLSSGGVTVYRQRVVISDNARSANFATVSAGSLQVIVTNNPVVTGQVSIAAGTSKIGFIGKISAGVVVSGQVSVTGSVAVSSLGAGANHIGEVNISIMPAVVLAAGTNNIGTIQAISAPVTLANGATVNISTMPSVVLAAGVANIGTIQAISAPVTLANGATVNISVMPALVAGTAHIGEVNISIMPAVVVTSITNAINVSAMPTVNVNLAAQSAGFTVAVSLGTQVVLAAGSANIGTIQAISAPVVLAAGTNNIGAVSLGAQVASGISVTAASVVMLAGFNSKVSAGAAGASAGAAWVDPNGRFVAVLNHPSIVASATQGPQNKDITATAFTTLVASAGANCIYVTGLLVTNGSSTQTPVAFCSSDQTAAPQVVAYLAANGGGFNKDFHPPWKLSAGTALQGRIFPTGGLSVTSVICFYVGP
jgi:hypothetical protein